MAHFGGDVNWNEKLQKIKKTKHWQKLLRAVVNCGEKGWRILKFGSVIQGRKLQLLDYYFQSSYPEEWSISFPNKKVFLESINKILYRYFFFKKKLYSLRVFKNQFSIHWAFKVKYVTFKRKQQYQQW